MSASLRTAKCSIVFQSVVFLETRVYAQCCIAVYTHKTHVCSPFGVTSCVGTHMTSSLCAATLGRGPRHPPWEVARHQSQRVVCGSLSTPWSLDLGLVLFQYLGQYSLSKHSKLRRGASSPAVENKCVQQ